MSDRDSQLADFAELIMSVSRRLNAVVRNDPGAVQLSSLERLVMRHIGQHPGATPTQIASLFSMKSSNTSKALQSLERRGFIDRVMDPDDGRGVLLYPTVAATENLGRVRDHWAALLEPYLPESANIPEFVRLLSDLDVKLN